MENITVDPRKPARKVKALVQLLLTRTRVRRTALLTRQGKTATAWLLLVYRNLLDRCR